MGDCATEQDSVVDAEIAGKPLDAIDEDSGQHAGPPLRVDQRLSQDTGVSLPAIGVTA